MGGLRWSERSLLELLVLQPRHPTMARGKDHWPPAGRAGHADGESTCNEKEKTEVSDCRACESWQNTSDRIYRESASRMEHLGLDSEDQRRLVNGRSARTVRMSLLCLARAS